MKCDVDWRQVADSARTTIGMEAGNGEPSRKWKKTILHAEHSPIRQLIFRWRWYDIPSWVSVHFVRHKFGVEHYIQTQRTDRTGVDRTKLTQDNPIIHECVANAQAIINISRKRLCSCASPETRDAWKMVLAEIKTVCPELVECCVPECVYRGFCPEFKSCGLTGSFKFDDLRIVYKLREV